MLTGVDTGELRRHCERRLRLLEDERRPWLEYCIEVAKELMPYRLPYLLDEFSNERGGEQNAHIIDAVGHLALSTAASGVFSGVMPQSSNWFDLAVRGQWGPDDELRGFLDESQGALLSMHNQSNASNAFPGTIKEWLAFGTCVALMLEDDIDDFRIDTLTVGEYFIADDHRGRVDTCYRRLTMTVGQLEESFGLDRLSSSTRLAYERGEYDTVIDCIHAIEPDRDGKNPHGASPDLPWRSVYYEKSADADQVLDVRGFSRFPVLASRMDKIPGSAYGYGRGHEALPHLVRLRKLIYEYHKALSFKARPPVQFPSTMHQHEIRLLPGGATQVAGQQPIKTLFDVQLELRDVAEEIERCRQDIRDTLGATLVASLRRITHQMTKREAELRKNEDLAEFLPGLPRIHDEMLSPYIEWLWDRAAEIGRLPQMPEQLEGQVIDIEFTSPLARRQRQDEVDAIVRTAGIAAEMTKVPGWEDVTDNINPDAALRIAAEIEGMPASAMETMQQVQELRAARQQQIQAQQQAIAAQQGADIAKTAAEAGSLELVA